MPNKNKSARERAMELMLRNANNGTKNTIRRDGSTKPGSTVSSNQTNTTTTSQSTSTSQSSNSSTTAQKSSQTAHTTSQGGSQGTSYSDKFYHAAGRKYTNKRRVETTTPGSSGRGKTTTANSRRTTTPRHRVDDEVKSDRPTLVVGGAGKQFVGGHIAGIGTAMQQWETDDKSILEGKYIGGEKGRKKYNTRRSDRLTESQAKEKAEGRRMGKGSRGLGVSINDFERVYDVDPNSLSQKLIKKGDEWIESGGQDIEQAKEGLGSLGKVGVDLVANGVQMLGDRALAFVPVVGQALAMGSLMNRAGGTASYEGRQSGMNADQQYQYALGTSLIEGLSEQMFNSVGAFKATYGKGALSIADNLSFKTAAKNIVQNVLKSDTGRAIAYNLARLGGGALEEGTEEVVADLAEPALKYMIMKSTDPNAEYDPTSLKDLGYDFLVGALMGGIPGSVDMIRGVRADVNLANSEAYKAFEDGNAYAQQYMDKAMVQGRVKDNGRILKTDAEVLAEKMQKQIDNGGQVLPGQTRRLMEALNESYTTNETSFRNKRARNYQEAAKKGETNNVVSSGSRAENEEFSGVSYEKELEYEDQARDLMGDNAKEESVEAVGRVLASTADSADVDTVLLDPDAKAALEILAPELQDSNLPVKHAEAREVIENVISSREIATRDSRLQEAQDRYAKNIEASLGNMREGAKELLSSNYQNAVSAMGDGSGGIYKELFNRIYIDGTTKGADFEKTYDNIIANNDKAIQEAFPKEFAKKIFDQGRMANVATVAKETAQAKAAKYAEQNKIEAHIEEAAKKYVDQQTFEDIDKFAKRSKVRVEIVEHIVAKDDNGNILYDENGKELRANGKYENGVIYIAADSDNKFITIAKHELTHHIKEISPERYQELEDFVFQRWYNSDSQAMQDAIVKYQKLYQNITPQQAKEEIIADASEAFFTDEGAIQDVCSFSGKLAKALSDGIHSLLDTFLAIQNADKKTRGLGGQFLKQMNILKDAERMWAEALDESVNTDRDAKNGAEAFEDPSTGEKVVYSLRKEAPPKKTRKGYKVFVVKNGELYPPMVANPNGEPTPVGVWLNADEGVRAGTSKTGRPQVKAGGKGTQGGSGTLAYRPGWHLGEMPLAQQFARQDSEGNKTLFPKNFVWAECVIAADVDYQDEAMSYGYTDNGKFRHSYAGLPKIPKDGFYQYRTNPDPNTVPWLITGAMKINRILSDAEVKDILAKEGIEAPKRQGGDKTLEELGIKQINTTKTEAKYSISYSQEEMDNHRAELENDAEANYGEKYTDDFNESGYVFPNGKMLKMGSYGMRGEDHAMASLAYDDIGYDTYFSPKAEAQKRFINEGNIRYMPENGWLNLGTEIEPTAEQYAWIRKAINNSSEGITRIEFTNMEGSTVDHKDYDRWASASDIINDIKRFYSTGKIGGSELSQFRYSLTASFEAVGCDIRMENGLIKAFNADGTEIKEFKPSDIRKSPLGRLLTLASTETRNRSKILSANDVNNQITFLTKLYNMILNTQDPDLIWAVSGTIGYDPKHALGNTSWLKEAKSKFASITGNADPQYKTTIDFTTICVKTQAVIDAMSKVMMDLGRGLTEHEIIDIVYKETAMAGEQVPCPVCYVFSRWVGLGNLFGKIKQFQQDYPEDMDMTAVRKEYESIKKEVDKLVKEQTGKKSGSKARNKLYAETIERKDLLDLKKQMPNKRLTAAEEKELEDLNRRLDILDHWSWLEKTRLADDYKAVPDDVLFDLNAGRAFATDYPATWRFRTTRGPALGKAVAPYSPSRLGDTIKGIASPSTLAKLGNSKRVFLNQKGLTTTAKKTYEKAIANAKRQNRMNGQRLQSTSDFRFEYGLDYLLSFIELEAIGAKAQMYTKVPEAVKFLASTGTEVNCSIMAKGTGLDENGELIFSDITGMSWEDARILSSMYDNVQPILVAIGREHLIKAMANKFITMIIPYHASGSSEDRYRSMMEAVGEAVEERTDFAEFENEHERADATPEQKLCRKLRVDILTGKFENGSLDAKEKAALKNNEILRQLYIRIYGKDENGNKAKPNRKYVENFDKDGNDSDCLEVYLTKEQAGVMMPYEYWDKQSNVKDADKQGEAYVKYCESLGITPVFSGWDSKGKYDANMDFTSYPGYWKTLIDRCMYNNDGTYHKQKAVSVNNVDLDMLDSNKMKKGIFKPMQTQNTEMTEQIAERSKEKIREEASQSKLSLSEDSDGNKLTKAQDEYFKDSKVRDKNGNLLVMYHGTDQAGFNTFKVGAMFKGIFFSSSRRTADAYGGNADSKLYNPNERETKTKATVGNFGDTALQESLRDFHFDTKEDYEKFVADHPGIENVRSEYELQRMLDEEEITENEYDKLRKLLKDVQKDYGKYERDHMGVATWQDLIDNPDAYGFNDFVRAIYAYDREASIDEGYEPDTKESLLEAMKTILAEDEEMRGKDETPLSDLSFAARLPIGQESEYVNKVNNRTYKTYVNLVNPLIVDAKGRNMNEGYYSYLEQGLKDNKYDGVIIKNVRIGKYNDEGYVVVAKEPNQVKLTSNENPTRNEDIRYSLKSDQTYLDAVKRKDWDKVRNLVDEAAREAGYDIHVYHSTNKDFTVFKGETNFLNDYFYFSPNKKWTRAFVREERYTKSKDIRTKEIFLKAKNILDASEEGDKTIPDWFDWFEEHGIKVTDKMRENHRGAATEDARTYPIPLWGLIQYDFKKGSEFETDYKTAFINAGYDGIHMPDTVRGRENIPGDTYVVFEPSQAKSADLVTRDDNRKVIPLSERFNEKNDDIRYSISESSDLIDRYITDRQKRINDGEQMSFFGSLNETLPSKPKEKTLSEQFYDDAIKTIADIRKKGSWTGNEITHLLDEVIGYQDFKFIERLNDKSDDNAQNDFTNFLTYFPDEEMLRLYKWYFSQYRIDKYWKTAFRSGKMKFNKLIDKRAEEIRAGKAGGRDIGIEKRDYTATEMRQLFNELNTDKELSALAKKVFDCIDKNFKVRYQGVSNIKGFNFTNEGTFGEAGGRTVHLNMKYFNSGAYTDQQKAHTLLHESIHTVTVYAINLYHGSDPYTLSFDIRQACEALDEVYNSIKYDKAFENEYGITNVKEMVAELSNPLFRAKLKAKNLYGRIVNAIKKMLGIKSSNDTMSAYTAANNALETLLNNADAYNFEKFANRVSSQYNGKFSLSESSKAAPTTKEYKSTVKKLEEQVSDLKAEFKRTNLKTADPKQVRIQAGRFLKRHDANNSLHGEVVDTFNKIFGLYKEKGTDAFDEVYEIAQKTAVDVVNSISVIHDEGAEDYKAIKDYLKNTEIKVSDEMKRNITDYNDFRKHNFGRLKLVNGETSNIDNVYMELMEMFPGQFTEDYVNPADQLYHIVDVLDNYAPYYESLDGASEEMQDYVVEIASDIMETAYNLQTKKTFADKKYEEKVRAVKKAREEALASRKKALNRQKERYEKKLEYIKQKKEERRARKKDSGARTKLLNIARRLSKIKSTEEFNNIRDALIGQLDLEAKSMTGRTKMKLEDLQKWYEDQVENNDWFVRNEKLEEKFKRLNKTHIADMNIEDVENLTDILLMLEHKIRNDKKLINSQYQHDVFRAAIETNNGIKESKGLKFFGLHKIDDVFVGQTLSPVRYMRRLVGYDENNPLMIATRELQEGQIKSLDYRMNALKPFNRFSDLKFVSYLNGRKAPEIEVNATTIDMKPTTVKIIPAIRIWFYLSSLNEDNMRHIVNGGVHIPDVKLLKAGKRTDAYDKGQLVRFSKSQVQAIINGMTAQEKAYAAQVYNYFNNVAPQATNEVSEQLDGITVAKVKNYLRISVDKNFLDVDADIIKRDGTLENMGSHKERVKSSKPVYAEDISDVLMNAIEADSKYVGMAIPIRNFNKIYRSSSMEAARGEAERKQITGTVDSSPAVTNGMPSVIGDEDSVKYKTLTGGYLSVQETIKKMWSSDAIRYIDEFISDLQFAQKPAGVLERALRSLTSNYAGAVLTLNASVAIKQAASFPTAAAVVGWKPLIKSMGRLGKLDLDYVDSVTPLLNYRTEGFNFRETGDIQNRGNRDGFFQRATRAKALNWIQGMDVLTTRKLFKAAQIYVEDNFKLKKGSEAYDKKVAEVYNRIITETQPNYTTMERPGHLRSDSTLERTLSMFKTQSYQNFNIWYDATGNYLAKRAEYKKTRTEENRKALKEASQNLLNATTSQIVQLAVFAAMSSLWALFRRRDDKYRDEDGNITFASYMKQLAKDMLGGASAEIFLGSEVFSAIESNVNGTYYTGFSSVTDSSINDILSSMKDTMTLVGKAFDHFTKGEEAETTTEDLLKQLEKVATEAGRFTGVPTGNVRNLINDTYGWVAMAADGKYIGTYEAQKMSFAKDAEMKANLFQAYRNDKTAYDQIRAMMIEDGFKEDSLDKYIKEQSKEHKTDSEQKTYDKSMQTLEGSSLWTSASAEDQARYSKVLEKLAVGIDDGETASYTKKMESGLSAETIILYKLALKKVDKPNSSGNLGTYTNDEKEAALRLLGSGLSSRQKDTLKG